MSITPGCTAKAFTREYSSPSYQCLRVSMTSFEKRRRTYRDELDETAKCMLRNTVVAAIGKPHQSSPGAYCDDISAGLIEMGHRGSISPTNQA